MRNIATLNGGARMMEGAACLAMRIGQKQQQQRR
jgi:hypothetical protein